MIKLLHTPCNLINQNGQWLGFSEDANLADRNSLLSWNQKRKW